MGAGYPASPEGVPYGEFRFGEFRFGEFRFGEFPLMPLPERATFPRAGLAGRVRRRGAKRVRAKHLHDPFEEVPMVREEISVQGMSCNHCVGRLHRALLDLPGVVDAAVQVGSVELRFDESVLTREQVDEAIRDVGFEPVVEIRD
jgi:copper chaperone